jgi:hypothetical protein
MINYDNFLHSDCLGYDGGLRWCGGNFSNGFFLEILPAIFLFYMFNGISGVISLVDTEIWFLFTTTSNFHAKTPMGQCFHPLSSSRTLHPARCKSRLCLCAVNIRFGGSGRKIDSRLCSLSLITRRSCGSQSLSTVSLTITQVKRCLH